MGDTDRTNVIIVGAGASNEFGLPTGAELISIIQQDLAIKVDRYGNLRSGSGDQELRRAITLLSRETSVPLGDYLDISKQISRNMALAPSIDNYLDTHKENENLVKVGKLAIANAIIKAEHGSKLFVDNNNIYNRIDFSKTMDTWAAVFFKIVAAKRDYVSFLSALKNITFISFNYDRCIKQFFCNAAASYFELDPPQTADVLAAIDVLHPYGAIGELDAQNSRTAGFAPEINGVEILNASKRIRTFTEGVSDVDLSEKIRMSLENAELLIFLGFSFIDINMQILKPQRGRAKRVLATAMGRSEDTKSILKREIERNFTRFNGTGESIEMFNGRCFELFYEFDSYLASSQAN